MMNARGRSIGLLVCALGLVPSLAQAQPANVYYERTVMTEANARCRLFAPEVGAALAAGAAQARGAALRGGTKREELAGVEARAREKAAGADCASADLRTAAERVAKAFSGFARLWRLSYPGDIAGWDADRMDSADARWRVSQQARIGADYVTFGLAGQKRPGVLLALARFGDDARPYGARLIMRDAERSPGPYLDRWNGGATKGVPLARRLPPAAAQRTFNAQARSPAGSDLLPKGVKTGWAFRFPDAAARELALLDPRESVAVEFLFPDDQARRAYVEVGDFAAGRAFVTIPSQ